LANAKPHEQLGLRLGLVPFTPEGSAVPLEEWLGLAPFPNAIELENSVGRSIYPEAAEVIKSEKFADKMFQRCIFVLFDWMASISDDRFERGLDLKSHCQIR
jgi:hypothetical protein